ncbi:MAG: hypothetical protein R2831_01170 [Chitinophagaceae bacterium]
MKKTLLISIIIYQLVAFNSKCFGQGALFNWAQNYTTPIDKIELDNLSNIYSIGGGTVSKRTSSGTLLWSRNITPINSLAVSPEGNVYITGGFTGTVNFNSWGAGYLMTSAGDNDIFVSKLNTNGNFVWAQRIGDVGADSATQISLDTLGHAYLTGKFSGSVDFDPGPGTQIHSNANNFILKLDTSGSFVWAKSLNIAGFPNSWEEGITLSKAYKDGYLYCVGMQYNSDLDPGPGIFVNNIGSDFLLKLDPSGNFVSAYIGPGFWGYPPHLNDMTLDHNKNVNLTTSSHTFGNQNYADISKYESSCVFQSSQNLLSSGTGNTIEIAGIDVDPQNRVYATGFFTDNVTIGNQQYFVPVDDFWQYDTRGAFLVSFNNNFTAPNWIRTFTNPFLSPMGVYVTNNCLAVSNNGCVYCAGSFNGNVNFNPSGTPYSLSSNTGSSHLNSFCNTTCSTIFTNVTDTVNCYTLINGGFINTSGNYTSNLVSSAGCDSVVNINLTVRNPAVDTISVSACNSFTYNG